MTAGQTRHHFTTRQSVEHREHFAVRSGRSREGFPIFDLGDHFYIWRWTAFALLICGSYLGFLRLKTALEAFMDPVSDKEVSQHVRLCPTAARVKLITSGAAKRQRAETL